MHPRLPFLTSLLLIIATALPASAQSRLEGELNSARTARSSASGWTTRGPDSGTEKHRVAVFPPGFSDVALLATNSIWVNAGANIVGQVVVNQASSSPVIGPNGSDLEVSRTATVEEIRAASILLNRNSNVLGDIYTNDLQDKGANVDPRSRLFPFSPEPVFDPLPPFQEADAGRVASASDVVVRAGTSETLPTPSDPNVYDYGDITVEADATLVFGGGVYNIGSITAGQGSQILFSAPTELRLVGRFAAGKNSTIGPGPGTASVSDIILYIGGFNGGDGSPGALPPAFWIGRDSAFGVNVYAKNGTALFDKGTVGSGASIAMNIQVEGAFELDPFFFNRPPAGDPLTVFTNGTEPLTITLTGSDPENDDLTFSAPEPGGEPTAGSLGPVVQDPPPFPGDPVGCNPENTDPCDPPDPPRTRATVVYTASGPGNVEDGFVFRATDTSGAFGLATVRINPPGDSTEPPAVQEISVIDTSVGTFKNTPVALNLIGAAPPGVILTYSIVSGPSDGVLDSLTDIPPNDATATYTPNTDFVGVDSFDFKACNTLDAFDCDTATATITVEAPSVLVENQNVVTPQETPVNVTLSASAFGVGGSALTGGGASRLLRLVPGRVSIKKAAFIDGAKITGNVSDADGDGSGDGRDNLPGPAPVLVAAGVDVNLGPASDPAGDASASANEDPDPDVVSATAYADGTNLYLSVRYAPGTFDPSLTRAQFSLDTDEDPTTGHLGSDAPCVNDKGIIGVEFLVNMGATLGSDSEVRDYLGACNDFGFVGNGTTTYVADGMDAIVPLSLLGGDDGNMDYKVTISEQLSGSSGFTGVLDYMPDVGLDPASTNAALNHGTARVQIEWDITGYESFVDDIVSARVLLNTEKGSVDSLDTFFFVGTENQDGLLTVSDFGAPAEELSGVVMPVPPGVEGTTGTFTIDVKHELVAALIRDDITHFSVQGRVDESLAGSGFKRGLQIRSTADGNLKSFLEPKLEITTPGVVSPETTFTIVTFPGFGILLDSNNVEIIDPEISDPNLRYLPKSGFVGLDSFQYTATVSGVPSTNTATVQIVVESGFGFGDCATNPIYCNNGRNGGGD